MSKLSFPAAQDSGGGDAKPTAGQGERPIAQALEQAAGLAFSNPGLAVRAVTHSSYANESPGEGEDYERLEFLGDAVLDFLVAYWLYRHFPELPEGDLTRMRSTLVRTETLAAFARKIGLNRILRLGKGERQAGGENRPTILCGVFEALTGAIVLDRGVEAAYGFLDPFFREEGAKLYERLASNDCKSLFQEKVQAKFGKTPGYRVVDITGPDHDRRYTIEVLVGDVSYGMGSGNSKLSAAQDAARKGLEKFQQEEEA